jgi:hypothetical protein
MTSASLSVRPAAHEYPPAFANYVALVHENDIQAGLHNQLEEALALLGNVSEKVGNTRHPPYTWSVKQVLGHITDGERVFGHRAFRFARNDPTPLPSFDENDYVRHAVFDEVPLSDLLREFELVRRANLLMLRYFPAAAWERSGIANGANVSVRALAFVMLGHVRHHLNILKKRLVA